MNNLKIASVTLLLGVALGAIVAKTYFPEVKEVQTEKEIIKTDVKVVTRVVERPDGTKETIIESTDKTVKREDKTSSKTNRKQPDYKANVIVKYSFEDKKESYGALVETRLAGPLFLGVYGDTEKNVGVSVGLEF